MPLSDSVKRIYTDILKEELVVAMGCTEPIAIAYAASVLRHVLGYLPTSLRIGLSGNIIKNVKSVVVPATGGMRGIGAAVSAGLLAGCPEKKLEVLCALSEADVPAIRAIAEQIPLEIYEAEGDTPFEILLEGEREGDRALVHLVKRHTNIVKVMHNSEDLTAGYQLSASASSAYAADRAQLNVQDIIAFAEEAELGSGSEIAPLLQRQLQMNMTIAEAGLSQEFGAAIGRLLYQDGNASLPNRARAYAAAGSDARMNGCELPVCIISGSGNQGITASVPVAVYAEAMNASQDTLLRALIVSDLITVHQKTGIGCLSAYCGAVSAGCACGCGIAYLHGGRYYEIAHTLVNALAILSGTICDGAKASCAAKISMAVEAGIMGFEMTRAGHQFYAGDGIVTKGVENTIRNVGKLAHDGMSETDREIIRIMLGK